VTPNSARHFSSSRGFSPDALYKDVLIVPRRGKHSLDTTVFHPFQVNPLCSPRLLFLTITLQQAVSIPTPVFSLWDGLLECISIESAGNPSLPAQKFPHFFFPFFHEAFPSELLVLSSSNPVNRNVDRPPISLISTSHIDDLTLGLSVRRLHSVDSEVIYWLASLWTF